MKNISNELKIYELSLIWREAEYNFAFWEDIKNTLNWDEEYKKALQRVLATNNTYEYYLELMRFVCLLKDGHTGVWFPKEITKSKEYFSKLPIDVDYIDKQYVITNVDVSVKNIVKRYSVIKKINNIDIYDYIKENIYPYIWHEKEESCVHQVINFILRGAINSEVELLLENDNEQYTVILTRTNKEINYCYPSTQFNSETLTTVFESNSHTIKMTNDNIAIITIDSMMNDELGEEIFKNFDLLKKAKGYIIDVRDNGGGNSSNSDNVASLFIGNKFKNDNTYHPVHIGVYKAWGKYFGFINMDEDEFKEKYKDNEFYSFYEKMYKVCNHTLYEHDESDTKIYNVPGKLEGPIVLLSSGYTASAAENFINVMRYNSNAIVVGEASFGSTGQPLVFELESGGGFRICTRRSLALDDSKFINVGFKPDVECRLSIDDYKTGNDSVMKKAIEVIRGKYE